MLSKMQAINCSVTKAKFMQIQYKEYITHAQM